MKQSEFEAMILEAIVNEGNLTTLGAENGVEIDTHGPSEGNKRPFEGWFRKGRTRSFFSGTITITLDEFSPDYDDDEDEDEDEEVSDDE